MHPPFLALNHAGWNSNSLNWLPLPDSAGILVSERHGGHVMVAPPYQPSQPTVSVLLLAVSNPDHCSSAVDQQGVQIAVAAFADLQQYLLTAAGMLAWHQSQPLTVCHS